MGLLSISVFKAYNEDPSVSHFVIESEYSLGAYHTGCRAYLATRISLNRTQCAAFRQHTNRAPGFFNPIYTYYSHAGPYRNRV